MAERDDLWLDWLAGEELSAEQAATLRAALVADQAWRAEMLADLRSHGSLRGLLAQDEAEFSRTVAERIHAGRDATSFIRKLRSRLPKRDHLRRRRPSLRGMWVLATAALLAIA